MNKEGQQEIVGFVLIVVLVMVGLMVFLIISVRDSGEVVESVGVSNMLDVLMSVTTDCAIVYEPDYDNLEDLFKSCFKGDSCGNLERTACDYLNESFKEVSSSMVLSDASVGGWEAEFFVREGEGILRWEDGNCSGTLNGAQRSIISGSTSLVIRLRVCGLV
ncbi:MAG: hypothetical protein V1888_02655 [archaeon]